MKNTYKNLTTIKKFKKLKKVLCFVMTLLLSCNFACMVFAEENHSKIDNINVDELKDKNISELNELISLIMQDEVKKELACI